MISSELLEKLFQFVDREISTAELEEWIIPRSFSIMADPESDDSDILAAFELGLVDMSAGSITEEEFREILRQEVRSKTETVWAEYPETNVHIVTGSSNQIIDSFAYYGEPVDIDVRLVGAQ